MMPKFAETLQLVQLDYGIQVPKYAAMLFPECAQNLYYCIRHRYPGNF